MIIAFFAQNQSISTKFGQTRIINKPGSGISNKKKEGATMTPPFSKAIPHRFLSVFAVLLFCLFLKIHGFVSFAHALDEIFPGGKFAGADAGA